jgi:hypothetical protein
MLKACLRASRDQTPVILAVQDVDWYVTNVRYGPQQSQGWRNNVLNAGSIGVIAKDKK